MKLSLLLIAAAATGGPVSAEAPAKELLDLCVKEMEQGQIPGLAVVVVAKGETAFEAQLGYSDLDAKKKVDRDTSFELASNSKAFTGLAMLELSSRHPLALHDKVGRFLPWLDLRWQGQKVDPTLGELLHQTSGVPERAVLDLSPTEGERALEEMIRALLPLELANPPGARFEYSSLNYDLLGAVIERVSGKSYAEAVRDLVLEPADLDQTGARWERVIGGELATGYKLGFWGPREYHPPRFEGNTPAAYVVSTPGDLGKWLKVQLATATVADSFAAAVQRAQTSSGAYAMGWFSEADGTLYHEGANPTFSSFVAVDERAGIGVAVLANLNSEHTPALGHRLLAKMRGAPQPIVVGEDELKEVDQIASSLSIALLVATAVIGLLIRRLRKKYFIAQKTLLWPSAALLTYGVLIYWAPPYFSGVPWMAMLVWGPLSLISAAACAALMGVGVYCAWVVRRS